MIKNLTTLPSIDSDNLQALHEWLAEHAMGWRHCPGDMDERRWLDPANDQFYWIGVEQHAQPNWQPSQRIEDAWMIVERLIHLFGPFIELVTRKQKWECALDLGEWDADGNWKDQSVRVREDTPQMAICAAAKAAMQRYI
jgi:hypothetical protein